MYKIVTASADATIYERNNNPDRTEQNTGIDEILDLNLEESSFAEYNSFRSRILMKFDNIPTWQGSGQYWLKLYETNNSTAIPLNFSVDVLRVTTDWEMGTGKYSDYPMVKNGVSWKYIDNSETSWTDEGGDYIGSNSASYSYEFNTEDLLVNISGIVEDWRGEEDNYGIIIKRSDSDEQVSGSSYLNFYSTEAHTIYQPKLIYKYDNSSFETGSLSALDVDNKEFLVYTYSMKNKYNKNSIVKFNVIGRELYPQKTYVTESVSTITNYYLPSSSYYAIQDVETDEYIIPFDDNYSKISCDSNSNYFILDMDGFEKDRYYKIKYKINTAAGRELYFDDNSVFKVV